MLMQWSVVIKRNFKLLRLVFGGVLAVLLLWGAYVAWVTYQVYTFSDHVVTDVEIVQHNILEATVEPIELSIDEEVAAINDIAALVNNPLYKLAGRLPIYGRTLNNLQRMPKDIEAFLLFDKDYEKMLRTALQSDSYVPKDGVINVAPFRDIARNSDDIYRRFHSIFSSVSSYAPTFNFAIPADMDNSVAKALQLARGMVNLLDCDHKRYVLVAVQNNAETRTNGGIVGAVLLISLKNGHIELEHHYSDTDFHSYDKSIILSQLRMLRYTVR
jgi:hypothetical protein